jgi:hypothetical protein
MRSGAGLATVKREGREDAQQDHPNFFGDPSATVAGGDYFFSYQDGACIQTTSSSYGEVTAYTAPPPALVKVPNVVGQRDERRCPRPSARGLRCVNQQGPR